MTCEVIGLVKRQFGWQQNLRQQQKDAGGEQGERGADKAREMLLARAASAAARGAARWRTAAPQRRWCSSGEAKTKSKTRLLAEELAQKRRAKARAASANSDTATGESLVGVAVIGVVALSGAGALLAFTEGGNKFFNDHLAPLPPVKWAIGEVGATFKPFTDPISDELLPDLPNEPGMRPIRTLVVDFENTLCYMSWDRKKGWRAVKRPGADQFLRRLCMHYEIVLFTTGNFAFLEPYVMALDPLGIMQSRLFREATVYENGEHIKDLSHLNRDLSRVVVVDDDPAAVKKHPENLVHIKPFEDPHSPDTALLDLIPFLEDLAERDVPDVREEIARYKGGDIASEFKSMQAKRQSQLAKERKGTLGDAIRSGGLLGGAGAPAPAGIGALQGQPPPPPMVELPMTPVEAADSLKAVPENLPAEAAQEKPVGSFWGALVK